MHGVTLAIRRRVHPTESLSRLESRLAEAQHKYGVEDYDICSMQSQRKENHKKSVAVAAAILHLCVGLARRTFCATQHNTYLVSQKAHQYEDRPQVHERHYKGTLEHPSILLGLLQLQGCAAPRPVR